MTSIEPNSNTATIKVMGKSFEVVVITETSPLNAIYLYTIITRVYGYDDNHACFTTTFQERPRHILYQRLSRRARPIDRAYSLEEVILRQPTPPCISLSS
jgi:hypothetical protein